MSKKTKTLLIAGGIFVVIVIMVIINTVLPKLQRNPTGFAGNTASNLNNGGTFCEYDGKVYFANSNDNDSLYVMNSDETHIKKISDTAVLALNVDDHRIYYSMSPKSNGQGLGYIRKNAGLYSVSHNGNSSICYTTNPVACAFLYENNLYYQNYQKKSGTSIFTITTSRENNHQVIDQMVTLTNASNGSLFFGNMNRDHYLYAFDPVTEASGSYVEKDMYIPVLDSDGWIYYLDPLDDYSLKKYSQAYGEEITLVEERLDFFNKYGEMIYYQVNSPSPALHRIYSDGTNDIILAEGVFSDIQTTSNYVYFRPFDDPSLTYHASHYGSLQVEPFRTSK